MKLVKLLTFNLIEDKITKMCQIYGYFPNFLLIVGHPRWNSVQESADYLFSI